MDTKYIAQLQRIRNGLIRRAARTKGRIAQVIGLPRNALIRVLNWFKRGLPIPSSKLIHLVAGSNDVAWFLHSGAMGAESIRGILGVNGLALDKFNTILDFGCGVGRVMRYWNSLSGPSFYGTDYNPELITWCHEHLKFARFQTNPLMGPLNYEDGFFDFIYALSVFSHLREPQQYYWIGELSRVLKAGGYLFMTVHGDCYLPQLSPEDQVQFRQGELVVYGGEHEGTNICAAFHPEEYVRRKLAVGWMFVDHVPKGATGNPMQDVFLLKKPEQSTS